MEFTKLNNGVQMPMHGIGTFLLSPDQAEASATSTQKRLSAYRYGKRLLQRKSSRQSNEKRRH